MKAEQIKAAILGGSGYVAGELLRVLAGHPRLPVSSVVSSTQAGEKVTQAFPHLAGTSVDGLAFESADSLAGRLGQGEQWALFAATPHGATGELIDRLLLAAEKAGATMRAVDLSADFRFPDPGEYQALHGRPHPAPARLPSFDCAVPEHHRGPAPLHAAQPGCFTTAVTLAAYPFLSLGLAAPEVFASAVTGSSGSGRKLGEGTHHPARRSALYAYSPLTHRHEAEMRSLLGKACPGIQVDFVPHSGPFVRGIHATLRLTLQEPIPAERLVEQVNAFYQGSPFVRASLQPPSLTEVVGTNRCRLGVASRGKTLVVTSVLDNLVKGSAGGGVQWMNRLLGFPEDEGLRLSGLGWY